MVFCLIQIQAEKEVNKILTSFGRQARMSPNAQFTLYQFHGGSTSHDIGSLAHYVASIKLKCFGDTGIDISF
jgi:hypothetical protein